MNRFAQLLATVLALAAHGLSATEVYVLTAGNDANPGNKTQPFATLERARDEIRKLKQAGLLAQPISVFVHGGTYRVGTSLVLDEQDSGTEAARIVWQAAAGEEVRLCGGVVSLKDAAHLTLRGFIVEASLGDGIEVTGCSGNWIEACQVRNMLSDSERDPRLRGHRFLSSTVRHASTRWTERPTGRVRRCSPSGAVARGAEGLIALPSTC